MAGLAAFRGYLDLYKVIALALLAGFLGDQFYFFLGRFKGHQVLGRFPRMLRRAARFDQLLARWHAPLIIGIRFMYGFRIVGPILLGMGRVPAWKFVMYNFIGAAIWAPLIAGLGYLFGSALEAVIHDLKRVELLAAGVLMLIGLVVLIVQMARQRRKDEAPPDA